MIRKILRKIRTKKTKERKVYKNGNYPNRFLKFYHQNKDRLNNERRSDYWKKKKAGICVRCSRKASKGIVFCSYHKKMQKKYAKQ